MTKVTANNPNSFLAYSALWCAYRYSADYGDMFRVEKLIRDRSLLPQSDYDYLFHYLMQLPVVPVEEIDDVIGALDGLIENHRGWGAAYAVRAVARDERGKEYGRIEDLRKAIDDIGEARSILKDSPLILTIALYILIDGIEIAEAEQSSRDVREWRDAGDEIRKKLAERPDCFMGRHQTTIFCHVTGQDPLAQRPVHKGL